MSEKESLFDKAEQNYLVAKTLMTTLGDDEVYLNYIGYHLQQAVELAIKYELENNGVNYHKTHDIEQLILLAKNNNVDLSVTQYIDNHSEMFTSWESKTRYILNYRLERRKIEAALDEVDFYLETVKQEYCLSNSSQLTR